jgi:hypothetical protein
MVPLVNLTYGVAMGQRPRTLSEIASDKGRPEDAMREYRAADSLLHPSSSPGRLTARFARLLLAALARPALGRDVR